MTDRLRPSATRLWPTPTTRLDLQGHYLGHRLEEKLITPDDKVRCAGYIQVGRRPLPLHQGPQGVSLHDAIVQSCNVFFYDLGSRPA